MFKNLFGERMSFREWFAWKLVCIAHKIFDADYHEVILIGNANIMVTGSKYGHGIVSSLGFDWDNIRHFDTANDAMDFIYGPEEK